MPDNESLADEVRALLVRGMGPELQWYPGEVSAQLLAETLVAMANGSGGTVLLGISTPSGLLHGLKDTRTAQDLYYQAVLLTDPILVLPLPDLIEVDGVKILKIHIPKGMPAVYTLQGRFIGRDGRRNVPLNARHLRRLMVERGTVRFESTIPDHSSIDDLDSFLVKDYLSTSNLPATETPEDILLHRGCVQKVDSALRPTYAGLLLFGKQPQRWLPNATILAARFPGNQIGDGYIKQEIRGTLPEQLRLAERFLTDHLESEVRLIGLTHQQRLEYPFEVVRELLVNAVAHRDYSLQGDSIHLNLFSDRLEIHSPGSLPGPVTLENLLEARFSRNVVVVQVLSDLGFMERLGYGLDRVVQVLGQQNFPPPIFSEAAGTFRVTVQKPAKQKETAVDLSVFMDIGLNPRQELALGFLAQHRRITNREFQELCPHVHMETLRRDFADLVKRGIILKIGEKRTTYYVLKKRRRI